MESQGPWARRLTVLALSLQGCAVLALVVVAAVSAAVIAVATRGGLMARRDAIEIVHGLGATDGYIAGRFARRATGLAAFGGACGAALALPALLTLARIAAPFAIAPAADTPAVLASDWLRDSMPGWSIGWPDWLGATLAALGALPASLWLALPGLPLTAAAIGFLTAEVTVRRWLRRLP